MRLSLAAVIACLLTAGARAEIIRVEFEGRLTSVDEGFPIPLAEEETISGHYLIDTETYLLSDSAVLGEVFIQPVREFSLMGSSGWRKYGLGQSVIFGGQIIPGSLFGRPRGSASINILTDDPIDFDNPLEVQKAIAAQRPNASFFTFEELFGANQRSEDVVAEASRGDLYLVPLFVNIGSSLTSRGLSINQDDGVTLGFTTLVRPPDQPLYPPLVESLAIQLPSDSNETTAASFNIVRVAVVPEPAAIGLAVIVALFGLRRRR